MNSIIDDGIVDQIDVALKLLKEKKVLYFKTLANGNTFFVLKQNRIYVNSVHASYFLKIDEFVELYQNQKFTIYEGEEEHFDFSRDDEYYSWKHK